MQKEQGCKMKNVLIYRTLGLACGNAETLRQMFAEGMDGMRLNLSHTTLEQASGLLEAFHRRLCSLHPALRLDLRCGHGT